MCQMSLKCTKNQEPKMTVSSISPLKEKRKNAKEQKNLLQKEVAMVFSCAPEPGVGRFIKAFYAGEVHVSLSSSRVGLRSC